MILWIGAASAADCPSELDEFDFRALVSQSTEEIFDDDVLGHKRLMDELVTRVPCLDHPVSRDVWARMLVNEAIVRYVARQDWQQPLGTALVLVPDLADVPSYLLEAMPRPPPVPLTEVAVPPDAALFVDGALFARVPVLRGQHIAQLWRDGRLESRWLDGGELPPEWLEPKPPVIVEVAPPDTRWDPYGRGGVGFGFGVFDANQLVEGEGSYLADGSHLGVLSAVTVHLAQPLARYGGLFADGSVWLVTPSVRRSRGEPSFEGSPLGLIRGYFGPAVVLRDVAIGIGGGVVQLQKVEGDVPRTVGFPQAHLMAAIRDGRGTFQAGAGLSPSAAHATARGGWLVGKIGPITPHVGFDAELGIAWFDEERVPAATATGGSAPDLRAAQALQLGVLACFEVVWGADR